MWLYVSVNSFYSICSQNTLWKHTEGYVSCCLYLECSCVMTVQWLFAGIKKLRLIAICEWLRQ